MKQLICLSLVLGLTAGVASAQSSGSDSSSSTSMSNTASHQAKKSKKVSKKVLIKPSKVLNNRRIYHWQNGQRSTPTGREAASINGGYQSLSRKPAVVKQEEE